MLVQSSALFISPGHWPIFDGFLNRFSLWADLSIGLGDQTNRNSRSRFPNEFVYDNNIISDKVAYLWMRIDRKARNRLKQ